MRRILLLLSIIASFSFSSCDTSENIRPRYESFVKIYGEEGNQLGVDLAQMPNSDLIVLGRVQEQLSSHVILFRVDTLGNEIWRLILKDEDPVTSEVPKKVVIDHDQNLVIAGTVHIPNTVASDVFLYKVSPDGNLLAQNTFNIAFNGSSSYIDFTEDLLVTPNNEYLVAGYTKQNQNAAEQMFNILVQNSLVGLNPDFDHQVQSKDPCENVINCQNEGEIIRSNVRVLNYNRSGNERFISVATSNREGFPDPANLLNIELVFLDNNSGNISYPTGTELQVYGTNSDDLLQAFSQLSSGRYIYAANIDRTLNSSILIGVLGADGLQTKQIIVDDRDLQVVDIAEIALNQYVILGVEAVNPDNNNIYMRGIDSEGNLLWEHAYGGEENDRAAALVVDKNRIFALGSIRLNTEDKIVLLKTTQKGNL